MRRRSPCLFCNGRSPLFPAPINHFRRRSIRHPLPPNPTLGSQRHIGKNRILRERSHRIWIRLRARPRSHPKESSLRIDRPQLPILIRLDPRNIVPNRPYLPPFKPRRRNHHRKVRLPASRRKRRRNISLFRLPVLICRRFHANNQHMLGHPPLIPSDVRSNSQRKTLLPQQRIPAIPRPIRPDLARLRKMHNVLLVIARPRHILLPRNQRSANRVHARHHALLVLIDLRKHRSPDPRHDPHIHHGISRIRQLHANLRHRPTDRPHRIRQHIHRPPAHRSRGRAASASSA